MTWGSFNGKEEQAFAQLDKAVELGANFIDTAELYPVAFNYGKTTEVWIGKWLAARRAEGKVDRSKLYIATKCNAAGIGSPLDEREGQPHGYDPEMLTASCKASIERLQCEYIDLYQLHWPSRDTPVFGCGQFYPDGKNRPPGFVDNGSPADFEKQVLAVKSLLDVGLIKHWGLSNENAYGITMFCVTCDRLGVPRPVSCQNDFSMLNRTYEADTWEAAYRFGVVGLPYGGLAGGTLTGKYLGGSGEKFSPDRPLTECRHVNQPEFQARYGQPMCMKATEQYVKIAEKYDLTPTELALAWTRQRPCNTSIITGTTTVRQMEECIKALMIDLSDEVLAEVDVVHEEFRNPVVFLSAEGKVLCLEAPWLGNKATSASKAAAPTLNGC
eukprot:CAMPEP_0119330590 /NCGR_PEP_ID=MMETSP1333-20130426/78542_1 /TAXON_ID=418940 /ORGANISM="Scyphosphaera apsteinii, Strain RCC1455" /LENGTH=384 /DNA_ID=CAMNT_0007339995 /DNA_START=165 /DNA_END=1319 /DNA_ORIENTATION=-